MQLEVLGISQGSWRVMVSCQNSWGSVRAQGNGSIVSGILEDGWGESWGSGRGLILDQMGISVT